MERFLDDASGQPASAVVPPRCSNLPIAQRLQFGQKYDDLDLASKVRRINMARIFGSLSFGILALALMTNSVFASDRYALLIGVNSYPALPKQKQLTRSLTDANSLCRHANQLGVQNKGGERPRPCKNEHGN
jgi:hypothetical protein